MWHAEFLGKTCTMLIYSHECIIELVVHNIDTSVRFSQSTYSFNEDDGPAQPALVLSNPSSTDITVQVIDTENTAISE